MKSLKNSYMGLNPVIKTFLIVTIVLFLMLGALMVLGGIFYLWMESINEPYIYDEGTIYLSGSAFSDLTTANDYDRIEIEVIGGTLIWADYKLTVDGDTWYTTETQSYVGESATFYDAAAGVATDADPGFDPGDLVNIKIINIGENMVLWEEDVIAKSYSS